ncbi:dephospho-CoA kinase [Desulfosporosinus sp.]|uniref:dephospho-CoA kinase n=1 Tax=Desulfosporosinus sp. TaxID=157907 RepID=UPI0025C3AD97|nr:dephospho-CoA kinase [Desulfosporosinus sp.]MBC2723200.1 dephospho-CoA kinase [Desulfosporosinus sp.]MBC2729022.1 dephospho-CoA kinase [Desulfosporosinus sp.]
MFNIGLTGGIGSGKSTVAQWFIKQEVPVLDADKTVHRLLQSDQRTITRLIEEFGSDIQTDNGQINRSRLGVRVFNDDDARKRLERIVHPRVKECMNEEKDALRKSGAMVCVWDVPLLFEAGLETSVDEVWVVWVPKDVQISRVLTRDKLSLDEIEARIAAQGSLDEKRQRADVVIDNSGNERQTVRQLEHAWEKLLQRLNVNHS